MPSGRQAGFTYVAMLAAVVIIGIGLAATGQVWSVANQRNREQELLFVGHEFRNAIQRYYEQTPGAAKRYPAKLEDLLQDKRDPGLRRYLRKLYRDSLTGKADWGLITAPDGGIMGVHSLSEGAPLKRAGFEGGQADFESAERYADWRFVVRMPSAPGAQPGVRPVPAPGR